MIQQALILVVALLGAVVVAQAQPAPHVHRIGILAYDVPPPAATRNLPGRAPRAWVRRREKHHYRGTECGGEERAAARAGRRAATGQGGCHPDREYPGSAGGQAGHGNDSHCDRARR